MHTIRLRHPWQCDSTSVGVCWSRPFNWPAGMQPREKALLVIDGLPESARVLLGDRLLVAEQGGEFDITEFISLHNRLAIELAGGTPTSETECPFEVRLEIVAA